MDFAQSTLVLHLSKLLEDLKLPEEQISRKIIFFFGNSWAGCLAMLKTFPLSKPDEVRSLLDRVEAEVTGSKELKLFVRAHLLMTRLVLYTANTPETFIKSAKVALKKVMRSLQLEIDTAMMLEMECVFVTTPNFEFIELFKEMVGPYHNLLDQSVITYLAEKLEIESELHTTMQIS